MKAMLVCCLGLACAVAGCCKTDDSARSEPVASAKASASPAETATAAATATVASPAQGGGIPEIPEGVSKPPTVAEWNDAPTINTVGANSEPKDCYMKLVREWLKVNCSGKIVRVDEVDGFGKQNVDHFESIKPGKSADYVVRLRKGVALKAKVRREDDAAALFVNWPAGASKPTIIALQAAPK
jgi:hypothetical protein